MLDIPEIDGASVAFGNVRHMPKYDTLPKEFQDGHGPYCDAVSSWFFNGAKRDGDSIIIGDKTFAPRPGVDATKALRAIKAVLGSFEPKHEHKEAACGFMLSEWFELQT